MASSNFDELTRALASSTSRRQALTALFVGVLGGVLGFGGPGTALARANCGAVGDHCTQNGECCTYTCDQTTGLCSCRGSGVGCSQHYECCLGKCSSGTCV